MWEEYLTYLIILFVIALIVIAFHKSYIIKKEDKLKKLKENTNSKYLNLVQLLPQTVFESDSKGNINFMNEYGMNFTSYNKFSLLNGLSLYDLIIEKEHKRLKEVLLYTCEGGLNKGQDFLLRDATGKFIPISLFLSATRNYKNQIELKGIISDATDKRKWENKVLGAILETEDKERKRFSEDLHDGLGPLLSTIKLYINQIIKGGITSAESKKLLNFTIELVEEAILSAKNISNSILPGAIEDNGLIPALNDFFERIRGISNNNIIFKTNVTENIPQNIEKTLYKIIYELINNTIKHSDSKIINIYIGFDGTILDLDYKDDGKGFDINNIKHGLGLNNIENRSKSLNAHYNLSSNPGEGMSYHLNLNL